MVGVYCVGLATFPATKNQISARDGLAAVYRSVPSIGRFTGTAFLAPLYSISELVQNFCWLCAVYCGTYTKHVVTNSSYAGCLRVTDKETLPRVHGQMLRGAFVLNTSLRDGMNRIMLIRLPKHSESGNPLAI
ncbi:unnamed protein product [Peronospora belbahrii]|uniref:Uncharacterized protein n=1 Tax=Peronospora belbahrii TaxID=622444 RepID=A0AAU9KKR4_9STRA|nr:unnamed protein product [Peronospora belbahrii]